jgi:phosphatidylglycerophosphate synthase
VSQAVCSAIVVGTGSQAAVPVAGVPLAVRAVVALHDAGFGDVALLAPGRPPRWAIEPLARRGVPVRWIGELGEMASSAPRSADALTLLLAGDVLVDAAAVRDLRGAMPGSVRTAAGRLVGVICPINEAPACASRAGFWTGSPEPGLPPDTSLAGTRIATGLVVPLEAAGSAARLERALLDHLADRTPGDSYLGALLDRPISRPLTRLLLRSRLSPSHITVLGVGIGILGAMGLATVSYWGRLLGVLLLIASLVLDCVDGDMARARLAQGPTGARLDLIGDYLVNLAVFGALAVGLLREGLPPGGAWAALVLITGVGAAMAAVHVLLIRPVLRRGEDLHWTGDDESLRGKPGATVVEKLASRDYTYLLLALAVVGHLEWFLYAAAVGAWAFAGIVVAYGVLAAPGRRPEAASQ